jgi:hypothetical protein
MNRFLQMIPLTYLRLFSSVQFYKNVWPEAYKLWHNKLERLSPVNFSFLDKAEGGRVLHPTLKYWTTVEIFARDQTH